MTSIKTPTYTFEVLNLETGKSIRFKDTLEDRLMHLINIVQAIEFVAPNVETMPIAERLEFVNSGGPRWFGGVYMRKLAI